MKLKKFEIFSIVISMFIYMCSGVVMGIGSAKTDTELFVGLIFFYLFFILHIIIHEAGHLVFGLATGYKFLSYRIGSFTIQKNENGKLELKKFSIPGTAGQCLLGVPDIPAEKCQYFLYHSGGGLMNIITSLIVLPFVFITDGIIEYMTLMFCTMGVVTALTNLIPLKSQGLNNDAFNIIEISQNDTTKRIIYNQLKMNYDLTFGTRYKDIDDKYFDTENSEGVLANSTKCSYGLKQLDCQNFEKAETVFSEIIESGTAGFYENEAKCELIFTKIILGCDEETIKSILDKKLEKYIKSTAKYFTSKQRLLYTINMFKNDKEKAEKNLKDFETTAKKYPIKADIILDHELIELVTEKFRTKI